MLKGKTDTEIEQTVERFMKEGELLSHGRIIRHPKVREYGLNVEAIATDTPLDRALWELQARCEHYVQARGLAKYLVCRSGGINVQAGKLA